jgi:hypothetical protein
MSLLGDHLPSRISASRPTITAVLLLADSLTVQLMESHAHIYHGSHGY